MKPKARLRASIAREAHQGVHAVFAGYAVNAFEDALWRNAGQASRPIRFPDCAALHPGYAGRRRHAGHFGSVRANRTQHREEAAMTFANSALARERPAGLRRQVRLPRRQRYLGSPEDWRDEVLYFLLVDRFSDGGEDTRPLLDRGNRWVARPNATDGTPWRWDRWAESGANRWQGGTLAGVASKLPYLQQLGVTALWLSPIFKQRGHLDTYHGYGAQDFLDVDPRLGSRQDLVHLCAAAHQRGMRIILDIIFNHSGKNWNYPPGTPGGQDKPDYNRTGHYPFGSWLDSRGQAVAAIGDSDRFRGPARH
jgi:Alpha amylase, catalytic domain